LDVHLDGFDLFSATPIPVVDRTAVDRWVLAHLAEAVEQDPRLTVLVGGRGAGKSTIVAGLRCLYGDVSS